MLMSAVKSYCFIPDILFNDFEDEDEHENGVFLTDNVNLVLADPLFNTHSAPGYPTTTHSVFSTRSMKDATRLVSSVMAPGAQRVMICSNLMFQH